jgi:hypothetical protein
VTSRPRRTAAIVLIAALLTGCSATAPETAPAPATTTTTGCGDAATTVRKHVTSSDVRAVTVNGQCTNVTLDTGLGDDDTAGGRQICETAAEVAYTGDINSVTVLSRSGAELSVGIPGMKCLP